MYNFCAEYVMCERSEVKVNESKIKQCYIMLFCSMAELCASGRWGWCAVLYGGEVLSLCRAV